MWSIALDAATGKELWQSSETATERGLAYWESPDRTDRRLILTAQNGLREIDARTGRLITSFGNNGFVDMRPGSPRRLGGPSNSPGRVFENLVIVGSNVGEGYGSPPGDVRAYDVRTGRLVWTFHTIPRPGEYGFESWPRESAAYAGGANTWGDITVDTKNAIVFLPTGSPTHDLYGADRAGNNLFGNCLIALERTHRSTAVAFPDRASRPLGLRPRRCAEAAHRPPRRALGGHRRASGQDRVSLRVRTNDRQASVADRRAAGSEERGAGRGLVADAADSDQAASVRATGLHPRRCEPACERGGTGAVAQGRA